MEKLADLPPLALLTFGATLAVIFAVCYLGLVASQKVAPANSSSSAQVAAVIVDPCALREATAVVRDLTEVLKDMTTEIDRMREELYIRRELDHRRN